MTVNPVTFLEYTSFWIDISKFLLFYNSFIIIRIAAFALNKFDNNDLHNFEQYKIDPHTHTHIPM